jgi:hypothetical protein
VAGVGPSAATERIHCHQQWPDTVDDQQRDARDEEIGERRSLEHRERHVDELAGRVDDHQEPTDQASERQEELEPDEDASLPMPPA